MMATEIRRSSRVIDPEAVESTPVAEPGAQGVRIQELITERDGAPTFAMRRFDVAVHGCTPLHTHAWEHEVYILEGEGALAGPEGEQPFQAGQAVYVPPCEQHRFRNTGTGPLRFLCMIPQQREGD